MIRDSTFAEAVSLLQAGRHKAALKLAKAGMRKQPGHPGFPNVAGIALSGTGKPRDAIAMFQKALKLDPAFADARKNLAQTLLLIDQAAPARRHLEKLAGQTPGDADVLYLLAQCVLQTGALDDAEATISRAIDMAPDGSRYFNLRAIIRSQSGKLDASLADYESALQINPNDVETLTNISLPLARQTRHDEALAVVRKAVSLNPDHIAARLRLATQLVEMGQPQDAISEYRAALDRDPQNAVAIEQLALLQNAQDNAGFEKTARTALARAPQKGDARAHLGFALAHIALQSGDARASAQYLSDANQVKARNWPYDARADAAQHQKIQSRFTDVVAAPSPTTEDPTAIFVLGLPRSGTSLTEVVLSAHSRVTPLGERATAGILAGPIIDGDKPFGPTEARKMAADYLHSLPHLPDGTIAFVDKMPENYRLIGFLKSAFPDCRIVHLRRDPRDVALSMWRGHFAGSALSYTYDLSAMAHRFNLYAAMMAHWHRVTPGQIFDLSYEDLVRDVTGTGKELAAYCGLDWEPAMATPEHTTVPVLTLSAAQLRQPVHTRSVGKWQAHAQMLRPFIDGLDPALWPGVR
jgi:tetratricopeptide (TPR) repeat protein